jgi:ubiquinone/menaquinone biosynthesis C-methylase UbiE
MSSDHQIDHNVRVHDRMSRRYEWIHGEIFNPIEQERLAEAARRAVSRIATGRIPIRALDAGCGTGNLTRHLLGIGLQVMAADVSTESLAHLRRSIHDMDQHARLETTRLNGRDLSNFPDGAFDLVAAYSLMHHVPDYLALLREMTRVLAPGGVLYIDHEAARSSWSGSLDYTEYQERAKPGWYRTERWRKFLIPENYIYKILRLVRPRLTAEGDLHVWPDDHIEWDDISRVLGECGLSDRVYEEYLLYVRGFDVDQYRSYRSRCADMAYMMATKPRNEP